MLSHIYEPFNLIMLLFHQITILEPTIESFTSRLTDQDGGMMIILFYRSATSPCQPKSSHITTPNLHFLRSSLCGSNQPATQPFPSRFSLRPSRTDGMDFLTSSWNQVYRAARILRCSAGLRSFCFVPFSAATLEQACHVTEVIVIHPIGIYYFGFSNIQRKTPVAYSLSLSSDHISKLAP